jgi:isopenicillin N synthase-like dioxygenase
VTSGNRSSHAPEIPVIDVEPLFGTDPAAWLLPDRELFAACRDTGFVCIRGVPAYVPLGPAERTRVLQIFALDENERRKLYRRKFAPGNRNIYRGWFPAQPGNLTSKEGIDLGGDIAHGAAITAAGDPLREPTPLPAEDRLPGWRPAAAVDVAPLEGTLVVNFGQVLEQWSAGRIRATEHRVVGTGVERYSIPFFYEARADATIAPLPVDPPDRFAPFLYGDFLWKRITAFVEFRGMEGERSVAEHPTPPEAAARACGIRPARQP